MLKLEDGHYKLINKRMLGYNAQDTQTLLVYITQLALCYAHHRVLCMINWIAIKEGSKDTNHNWIKVVIITDLRQRQKLA